MKLDFLHLNLRNNIYENKKFPVSHSKNSKQFHFSDDKNFKIHQKPLFLTSIFEISVVWPRFKEI